MGNPKLRNSAVIHKCQRSDSGEYARILTVCVRFLTCSIIIILVFTDVALS